MAGLLRKWNRVHEEMREDSLTTTPKISIIIPVYNVEDYLRPCLDSMIDQTVKEIEIICVDDGSTDGSGTLCNQYRAQFPAMVRVLHQKNQGVSAARNAGMQMARGEYLTFVDPDDWLEPDMLRTMLEEMQKAIADIPIVDVKMHRPRSVVLRSGFAARKKRIFFTSRKKEAQWMGSKPCTNA